MESDIDIKRFVRTLSFYKRIKNIADRRPSCINVQTADNNADDDGFCQVGETEVDNVNANEKNISNEINNNPDKIRRHLPPGSGPFSVGCVDIMDNSNEEGSFFRLFYPVEKTDIMVSFN